MQRSDIMDWLVQENPDRLERLWSQADKVRRQHVGDAVHLRGLMEISNHCRRHCHYCGLRVDNAHVQRYRMTPDEILDCARQALSFGYGTVVLQAGEDLAISADWMADVITRIKRETSLALTLSLGERTSDELALWRHAGADRYLLRFETSNLQLLEKIHPPLSPDAPKRFDVLALLAELGYEVGSGVMIGIPGQTYEDLANDIQRFAELDLDMIGVGPFIAHGSTPLGNQAPDTSQRQVPNTELMTYKVMALARLNCPNANIPSTTALATLNLAQGRELGLMRGANVVMPNITPPKYRQMYEIYPAKACLKETADDCHNCMLRRIESIGRHAGQGRGDSPNYRRRTTGTDNIEQEMHS